jgi:hypothetical protein
MEEVTGCAVREYNFTNTEKTFFFPSPENISTHQHSQKRKNVPEKHAKWLVVSFLWEEMEEEHEAGRSEEFNFEEELQKELANKSSSSS